MLNIGGQPYSCGDCDFQHLDWERMVTHIHKRHQREPRCGPDRTLTPDNIEVGRVLVNNKTMERVRITEIIDRAKLRFKAVPVGMPPDVFAWNQQEESWGMA